METADAFSNLQDDYNIARPNYPNAALDYLKNCLGDAQGLNLLDVGCGTGIFTRQLATMFMDSKIQGCDINADMISRAREILSPKTDFKVSIAEQLPFPDLEFHLITVAQAVQWFDRPLFYVEAMRLLKPGGILALIENNRVWQNCDFLSDYETLLEKYSIDYSRHYRNHDYAGEMTNYGFDKVSIFEHIWTREMHPDAFIQMSKSSTKMQSAIKAHGQIVVQELVQLIAKYSSSNGTLSIDYVTKLVTGVVD